MHIDIDGHTQYAYTGGKTWLAHQPVVVLIHGVLNDHSVWILQSRHLAHHGYNVLALDLPGHGRSQGLCPPTVAAASHAVLAWLDALAVPQAALVGHSWGSLIALHTAATAPERVHHLGLVGTASPMRVSPALLQRSQQAPLEAIEMVNSFSHSTWAPGPSALGPGTWVPGASRALMRHLLRNSPDAALFHTGFSACDRYDEAQTRMAQVRCPVGFVLGLHDQMTPPKAAAGLQAVAQATGLDVQTTVLNAGHSLMTEAPDGTRDALMALLARPAPASSPASH